MEFSISKNMLQKELGFLQGVIERKNTIPALAYILIESMGESAIRITGTDMDTTLRCEVEADIKRPGSMCVMARKLFDISRLLPDASVNFRREANDWASIDCERSSFRVAGIGKETFPDVSNFRQSQARMDAAVFKTLIDHTIFAITLEESRYTLSGAKFIFTGEKVRMVTTDGHRLAFIERKGLSPTAEGETVDVLIPRKALAELTRLTAGYEGEIGFASDNNNIYFEIGGRLLVARTLSGQFPNYEMVMPKDSDKKVLLDAGEFSRMVRRVSLMADERTRSIRLTFSQNSLELDSQSAEEGEARESLSIDYDGEEVKIGFNASYIQDFLDVITEGQITFEFKDSASQAQMRPVGESEFEYRYVVMPLRV